uniref:SCD domain-containing protein n=1 Tax=Anas platyrhynchos TaxID=8839 RepID=A0A8B9R1Q6_ANAPL
MKLLTAVVGVHLNLDVNKHNAQRLYEVEKNRISGKKTNYRLDQLERKRKELLEIQNMMNAIFKGTFLSRYRDVIPEIRATCMEEIGSLINTYPDTYLNDSYLKYIGWMLYDKQPEVRLKCLLGLQGIYSRRELVYKMDLFTSRFKDRIVSMPLDKDHEVAVQAMKLLMLMNYEDVLSDEDCETLYRLVYTTHRPLAVAAGEFLYNRYLCLFLAYSHLFQNEVVFLLIMYSLWDWAGTFLKDWECMTTLLLKNDGGDREALNDAQKSALTEIILATVREAAEGHPPAGRGAAKKVSILSVKEKKIQSEDCTKITEHFIMVLPQLLAKYSTDAQKVANLLQIPQYYDLDVYSMGHLEKHLDALLKEVKDIVVKHSDISVLEASSRTYYILCSEEIAIYNQVDRARTQLIDELAGQLNQLLDGFWQKVSVTHCRDKHAHDLTKWKLYDKTLRLLLFEIQHGCLSVLVIGMKSKMVSGSFIGFVCLIQAFVILCDWLLILSHQDSNNNEEEVGFLDYLPSTSLQEKLLLFVQEHIFVEEKEESKEEERKDENYKLDDLHKKRSLLAAYCKLIVFNVVETTAAAEIYKHYVKLFQTCAESQDSSTGVDLASASFTNMKELARRFSLTFGWDQVKSRESVAMIHKEGIEFAFQGATGTDGKSFPPNLSFLLIISEFSYKLLKPDKKIIKHEDTSAFWNSLANYSNTCQKRFCFGEEAMKQKKKNDSSC